MKLNLTTKTMLLFSLFFATSSFAMSSLVSRLNIGIRPLNIPAVRYISTKPATVTVSDVRSICDIMRYGVDSTTLQTAKDIEESLKTIKQGCYCGNDRQDTADRQKKLILISKALKNLAAKTTRKNCDLNSEIYKKTK